MCSPNGCASSPPPLDTSFQPSVCAVVPAPCAVPNPCVVATATTFAAPGTDIAPPCVAAPTATTFATAVSTVFAFESAAFASTAAAFAAPASATIYAVVTSPGITAPLPETPARRRAHPNLGACPAPPTRESCSDVRNRTGFAGFAAAAAAVIAAAAVVAAAAAAVAAAAAANTASVAVTTDVAAAASVPPPTPTPPAALTTASPAAVQLQTAALVVGVEDVHALSGEGACAELGRRQCGSVAVLQCCPEAQSGCDAPVGACTCVAGADAEGAQDALGGIQWDGILWILWSGVGSCGAI